MIQSVNDIGCKSVAKTLTLTKALPAAPTTLTLTDGITTTAITNISKYIGTSTVLKLTTGAVATATSYEWELPTGVNRTDASGTNSTLPYIYINLLGVTSSNTPSYVSTTGVLTYVLRLGVKSKNGVGVSITNNSTLLNPTTTSTSKLLTLTAVAPAAPASLALTNPAIGVTAITTISKYIGTSTYLTLTAAESPLASSYEWELPSGVYANPSSNLTSRIILVNFLDVPTGTTVLRIGVKAKNGVGVSVTNNTALANPSTTSVSYTHLRAHETN
jgi:hypothetical protein